MSKEEKVSVKVLLSTINYAIEQIANFDNEFRTKLSDLDAVFFDPSRRSEKGRTVKTEEYTPPLDFVKELLKLSPNLCVKISPGTEIQRIKYDCDIEVISNRSRVREVVLWFGGLKLHQDKKRILATKLPEKITMLLEVSTLEPR